MVLWVADYLINFVSYYIVYRWIISLPFRKNVLFNIGVVAASSLLVIGLCQSYIFGYDGVVISMVALASLLVLVREKHTMVLLIFPIAFLASGAVSISVTYLLSFITQMPYPVFMDSKWRGLLSETVFPIVFLILFLCSKRVREERDTLTFNIPQYLIALLGSVCLFAIIAISQGMMKERTELKQFTYLFVW